MSMTSLLDWLNAHVYWLGGFLGASTVIKIAVRRARAAVTSFLEPSIKHGVRGLGGTIAVTVRNFEVAEVALPVGVDVTWPEDTEPTKVAVRAGPWAPSRAPIEWRTDNGRHASLRLRLDGLPPDAAVGLDLEFPRAIDPSSIRVTSANDRAYLRLALPPIKDFKAAIGHMHYAFRLLFGLGLYIVLAAWLLPGPHGATSVDVSVFIAGLVLVALAWTAVMPSHGKDTMCGYAARVVYSRGVPPGR